MIDKNTVGLLEMHYIHLRKAQYEINGLALTDNDKVRICQDLEDCVFTELARQLMEVALKQPIEAKP